MADIAKEAGLVPDEPMLTGVSKVLVYLWNVAWDNGPGTLQGDADALHDMRVAMRRLRTAIQSFEGPKASPLVAPHLRRELARRRRRLGELGDALGAVRDFDVLQDYLKDYLKEHGPKAKAGGKRKGSGFEHLKRDLQEEREAVFPEMVQGVEEAMQPGELREKFARFALGLPGAFGPQLDVRGAAQLIIPRRVEEVLACAPNLNDPHDDPGHHEMRKSLRRLRYSLEVLSPCLSEPVEPHLKTLVELQDDLGEMQDRSVLRLTVYKAFDLDVSEDDQDPGHAVDTGDLPKDVREFLDYGNERRHDLLKQARDLWKDQQKQNWPQSLSAL